MKVLIVADESRKDLFDVGGIRGCPDCGDRIHLVKFCLSTEFNLRDVAEFDVVVIDYKVDGKVELAQLIRNRYDSKFIVGIEWWYKDIFYHTESSDRDKIREVLEEIFIKIQNDRPLFFLVNTPR